jgi:peptidoglycan hydrolase FlgJ
MSISSIRSTHVPSPSSAPKPEAAAELLSQADSQKEDKTREAFQEFVGQTFYGQLMQSMRKTVGKPAYFHGGRAEEVFQGQLDQVLTDRMSKATASTFSEPMYRLFQLQRS